MAVHVHPSVSSCLCFFFVLFSVSFVIALFCFAFSLAPSFSSLLPPPLFFFCFVFPFLLLCSLIVRMRVLVVVARMSHSFCDGRVGLGWVGNLLFRWFGFGAIAYVFCFAKWAHVAPVFVVESGGQPHNPCLM